MGLPVHKTYDKGLKIVGFKENVERAKIAIESLLTEMEKKVILFT